jgi:hypothetical protein
VVLRGDRAEGVADRTVALLVVLGHLREETGEARGRRLTGQLVVRPQEGGTDDLTRCVRHLLRTDDQHGARSAGKE